MPGTHKPVITDRDRDRLASEFGVGPEPTMDELGERVDPPTDPRFASVRSAVRDELSEPIDADLVDRALAELETALGGAESVREAGVPERFGDGDAGIERLYRELVDPVRECFRHLESIGFFESAEEALPTFTPETIDHAARGLVTTPALVEGLSACGFDEHERTALLLDVVSNDVRLSRWVPRREIPDGVEFTVEFVPSLHHRAIGGGLLWVNALDRHLVQKRILLTESIVDDAFWRSKAIVGAVTVFLRGVRAVATDDDLSDDAVVAALVGGSALAIVNQEELMREAFWLHEEKRAPSRAR